MSLISFTGVPDSYPLPSTLVQINFAQGAVSGGTTVYAAIILANKLASGSASSDGYIYGSSTAIPLQTVQDAISLLGAGSESMIMYRDFIVRNPNTPVFVAPVKESSGSQATLALTVSGTATAAGTVRVFTPEGPIDTGFSSGDSPTVIMANVAINLGGGTLATNSTFLPFTAAASTGTCTLTAKQKGLRGNLLRAGIVVLGSGTGVTVTAPATGFMSNFSGGTTADSNANVITYLEGLGRRFYYIVSAAEDATQFGAVSAMVNLMALPTTGIRQRCFAGSIDTLANVETITQAVNSPRAEDIWLQNSDYCPSRLAAIAASVYSLEEASLGSDFSVNFSHYGSTPSTQPFWGIPAPLDGSSPSVTSQVSALNSGVSPISTLAGGRTQLVRRITTYFLNGSTNDYRCRDASQVTISDFFADDVSVAATLRFAGKTIGNDPAPGQPLPPPTTITPRQYRSLINEFIALYNNRALLQDAADTIASTVVLRETSPSTRLSAQVPLQPIEILLQIGLVVNQDTPSQ